MIDCIIVRATCIFDLCFAQTNARTLGAQAARSVMPETAVNKKTLSVLSKKEPDKQCSDIACSLRASMESTIVYVCVCVCFVSICVVDSKYKYSRKSYD